MKIANAGRWSALYGLALCATTSPASACMSSGPDGYTSGLIWKTKPQSLPGDAIALNVEYVGQAASSWGFVATVRDGPSNMRNRSYRFTAEGMTSCTGLGREKGFIVVRRNPVLRQNNDNQKNQFYLSAVGYQPSWLDWLVRLFSDENWHYPGKFLDPGLLGRSTAIAPEVVDK